MGGAEYFVCFILFVLFWCVVYVVKNDRDNGLKEAIEDFGVKLREKKKMPIEVSEVLFLKKKSEIETQIKNEIDRSVFIFLFRIKARKRIIKRLEDLVGALTMYVGLVIVLVS